MAHILCIESSGKNCSVAISSHGNVTACVEHTSENYAHAEDLHPFIEQALAQANLQMQDLEAVIVSKGPGSYTGLRIGVSAAKGICYALQIPLLAISTLELIARRAKRANPEADHIMSMIDARRMEVYTATFDSTFKMLEPVRAVVVDPNFFQNKPSGYFYAGDGADKCEDIMHQNSALIKGVLPSAYDMAIPAEAAFLSSQFEDLAYFEPFYLKDFVPGIPKKILS